MENQNTYEKIVRNSLHHIACIDDDFIEPYKYTKDTDEEKTRFTQDMYHTLRDRCDGHVELQKYYSGIDKSQLEKCMINKDLLVLDWELTGSNDKPALELIAQAVDLQIPFICIYTNRPDIENIYTVICNYFSGYSGSSVEEACEHWIDAGVLEDEFKSDVTELFSGADEKMHTLIKRFDEEDEETKSILKGLEYRNKESWHPLYLNWNHAILPEKPLPKAENLSNKAALVDGKIIVCLSKSGTNSEESVDIDELIPSIARHITNVPNSIFDIVWLYYTNFLRKVLHARSNLFSNIDSRSLGWFAAGLSDEGPDVLEDFIKGLYRDEIMDCLDINKVKLPECILERIKEEYHSINPHNYTKQFMELNERITVNHLYSGIRHKIDFGDIFVVEQKPYPNTFWLCVTAKCECLRESKIDNNYLFIKGVQIKKPATAIKNAESGFRSFVKYNGEIISIEWSSKLGSIYFRPGENMIDGIGKSVVGNYRGENLNYTYLCNLKENYTQRMANEAFSAGNKVGITLAQIRVEKEEES